MKLIVVGLGSMGSRRVRDLRHLGHEVCGYDIRPDRRVRAKDRFGIATIDHRDQIKAHVFDAVVISTPPDQHEPYYLSCLAGGLPFFSEANILTPKPDFFSNSHVASFPSATWRFNPMFQEIRRLAHSKGDIFSGHYHYFSYLPSWHPNEDPVGYYAFQRPTCAAREMVPFELDWVIWIFGRAHSVSATIGDRAFRQYGIFDSYLLHIRFESGFLFSLQVELHHRAFSEKGTISMADGAIHFDTDKDEISFVKDGEQFPRKHSFPRLSAGPSLDLEALYLKEIEGFISGLQGKPYPKTWEEDRHLSDLLVAAEKSHTEKRWVRLSEVSPSYTGLWKDDLVPAQP